MVRAFRTSIYSPAKPIDEMNECQARVLAMLIDTEGSINPDKCEDNNGVYYKPQICVGMASLLILFMAKIWGGRVQRKEGKEKEKKTERGTEKNKRMYYWTISSYSDGRSQQFLRKIEPYLTTKKTQARLGLEMLEILTLNVNDRPTNWTESLQSIAVKIRELNRHREPPCLDTEQINNMSMEELLSLASDEDLDKKDFAKYWGLNKGE
jgi:hypothetical protein